MQHRITISLLLIILLCSVCLPAGAILQTFTFRGSVTELRPETGNCTILATHRWGCSHDNDTVTCGWVAISPQVLTGKVPAGDAVLVLKSGNTVEAVSLGNPGGNWIGLGRLVPDYAREGWYATDLFGDVNSLPAPLASSYAVTTVTAPDCLNCTRPLCSAESSMVTINRYSVPRMNRSLLPGQSLFYEDPADLSSVSVTFIRGQASGQQCPNASGGISTVQPVSVYVIRVEPPPIGPIARVSTGTLAVASIPSRAIVSLDGKEAGNTPFSLRGVVPGSHTLRVEKEGYTPWVRDVTIPAGGYSTFTADLRPLYGSLRILSNPSHAAITVDGADRGFTPLTLSGIPEGSHQVTIEKEGFKEEDRAAYVAGGGITLLIADLTPVSPAGAQAG
jgi:hypothetical protein